MMRRYETLILTVPEVTQDEAKGLERQLEKLIQHEKGTLLLFDRWGKYKLAYPIKNNEYGVYFLLRFEVPESADAVVKEIRNLFSVKMRDLVMRFMTSALEADAGLTYQRPPSLEDTPTRDVGSFLKENKMDGLLPDKKEKAKEASEDKEKEPVVAEQEQGEDTADSQ